MAIKIPEVYMGKPIKGAMQLILAAGRTPSARSHRRTRNASQSLPSPSNLANAADYVILEAKQHKSYSYPDMLVPVDKNHLGNDWNQTHVILQQNGEYMLTIRQFADFLSLLKSGKAFDGTGKLINQRKLNSILEDIIKVRDPWRSEWLDAKFEGGNIIYHTLNGNKLTEVNEPLVNYIRTDKVQGISVNDWLQKANYHGLPTSKTKKGSLYYWAPTDGKVARFVAGSDRAGLGCYGNPSVTVASLGVRAARKKI